MIIGNNNSNNTNNNFNNNQSYSNDIESFIQNNKPKKKSFKNIFTRGLFSFGANSKSKDDMYEKSIAMLNERLEKGTISFEEFNRKCMEIAKKRNK